MATTNERERALAAQPDFRHMARIAAKAEQDRLALAAAIQAAYDAGDIELGQRLQRSAGIALGGSAASGGAMRS